MCVDARHVEMLDFVSLLTYGLAVEKYLTEVWEVAFYI